MSGGPPPLRGRDVVRDAFRRSRRGTALSAGMTCVHQVCEAATPVIVGLAVDRAVVEGDLGAALAWIGLLTAVYVLLSAAGNGALPVGERAATRAEHDVRLAIVARVLDPRGTARHRASGEVLSVAGTDAAAVGSVVNAVSGATSALAAFAAATVALMVISVPLGLVALGCVIVVVVVVPWLGRPLEERIGAQQAAAADVSALAVDLIGGLRILAGIGARPAAAVRFRAMSREAMGTRIRAAGAEGLFVGVTGTVAGLLLVVVAAVGAHLAVDGDITIGGLIASVGLATFLVGPVSRLAYTGAEVAGIRASARRVAAVLSDPYAVPDGEHGAVPAGGALALRGVAGEALRGLDLEAVPDELLGVACDDPAAARELLEVLARDADPVEGAVTLGDAAAGAVRIETWRAAVAVVPHDSEIFTEGLADLLGADGDAALGAAEAREVAQAVADAGASHRGLTLSGGQRQRLALARALALGAPVLVLDEPTTALDAATESRVAAGLADLRRGRTTVIVTASAGLLARADRVVLVSGGRAVASGTHEDLLAREDYAGLVTG